jgi:starch phosphorylase
MVSEDRLKELAKDDALLSHLERVRWDLTTYLSRSSWYHQNNGGDHSRLIAYFSLEFAITEALPIYSGGLGTLAGDHLKSASDLGVPLVAVGLLYQEGYFRQQLILDGY